MKAPLMSSRDWNKRQWLGLSAIVNQDTLSSVLDGTLTLTAELEAILRRCFPAVEPKQVLECFCQQRAEIHLLVSLLGDQRLRVASLVALQKDGTQSSSLCTPTAAGTAASPFSTESAASPLPPVGKRSAIRKTNKHQQEKVIIATKKEEVQLVSSSTTTPQKKPYLDSSTSSSSTSVEASKRAKRKGTTSKTRQSKSLPKRTPTKRLRRCSSNEADEPELILQSKQTVPQHQPAATSSSVVLRLPIPSPLPPGDVCCIECLESSGDVLQCRYCQLYRHEACGGVFVDDTELHACRLCRRNLGVGSSASEIDSASSTDEHISSEETDTSLSGFLVDSDDEEEEDEIDSDPPPSSTASKESSVQLEQKRQRRDHVTPTKKKGAAKKVSR